ncbi:hypothetical protein AAF712_014220 [Marasmius tenuissimus]|uniref:Uncharacterized protein n=1 Tax=Marasmius tenuissimus TaxID=585030 RepID=A0ABR2ZE40_9AGAR
MEFASPKFPIAGLLACTPDISQLNIEAKCTMEWTTPHDPAEYEELHIPVVDVLETLTVSKDGTGETLVPALRSLSLGFGPPLNVDNASTITEALLTMVSSRRAKRRRISDDDDGSPILSEFEFIYDSPIELQSALAEPSFRTRLEAVMDGAARCVVQPGEI